MKAVSPKLLARISLCLIGLCATRAMGRGGEYVGNGDGFAEMNINYAYQILPDAIQSCINLAEICLRDAPEKQRALDVILLGRIKSIAIEQPASPSRIQLKTEKEAEEMGIPFDVATNQPHRFAQTGLAPSSPVYWNRDQLYRIGSPALDLGVLLAIWVHEIGHQTGISIEHNGSSVEFDLDTLGARVRRFFENKAMVTTRMPVPGLDASVITINQQDTTGSVGEIFLSSSFVAARLTPLVSRLIKGECTGPNDQLMGWGISGASWPHPALVAISGYSSEARLPFSAWLDIRCSDGAVLRKRIVSFSFTFRFVEDGGQMRPVRVELPDGEDYDLSAIPDN